MPPALVEGVRLLRGDRQSFAFLVDISLVVFPMAFCILVLLNAPTVPEAWGMIALVAGAASFMMWVRLRGRGRLARDIAGGELDVVSGPAALDWVRTSPGQTAGKGVYRWYRLTLHDGRRIGISESLHGQLLLLARPSATTSTAGHLTESGTIYRIEQLTAFVLPETSHIVAIHDATNREIYREPLFRSIPFEL